MARPRTHVERWRRSSGCPLAAAQRPGGGAHEDGERAEQPVVHVEGHEEARGLGNSDDGELGPPAMADARPAAERSEESARGSEQGVEKGMESSAGALVIRIGRRGTRHGGGALLAHGGHVHGQVPPVEAFHRARGGQRRGQDGTPFWAASRPN